MAVSPSAIAEPASERVLQLFLALPQLVAADPDLIRRGRFLSTEFEIGVGVVPLLVSVANGEVRSVARGPFLLKPWVFALRAEPATWEALLQPVPAPGVHDLMALSKTGRVRIEGNLQPFMANLQYVKDVLTKPRALAPELAPELAKAPAQELAQEPVKGRGQ